MKIIERYETLEMSPWYWIIMLYTYNKFKWKYACHWSIYILIRDILIIPYISWQSFFFVTLSAFFKIRNFYVHLMRHLDICAFGCKVSITLLDILIVHLIITACPLVTFLDFSFWYQKLLFTSKTSCTKNFTFVFKEF